ncbi:hypothetical protein DXX93_01685 [Thalassotalea euphylliae]|uniref:Uncharacterized protein n=1 Tax=Thalassotalea euphylliae TaxID=1655234 RepID=A0A3E0TLF8_9GAMM|nr:hypothetical protein DXX93_01685 [Thalassotalea euphylliae]
MSSMIFWKLLFWVTLFWSGFDIYSQMATPEELKYQIPLYLTIVNAAVIFFLLYGLYVFSYQPVKVFGLLRSSNIWNGCTLVIFISAAASLYFEFGTGNYTLHEGAMISIISLIVFLPYAYALTRLAKQFKRK